MILKLAIRNLLRNRRRTTAIVLTVGFGTSALFLFHGFNTGVMNQYRESTIHSRYGNGQINTKGYLEKVYEEPWQHWMENTEELRQKLLKIPGVKYVFPRTQFFSLLSNGRVTVAGLGQGVDGPPEAEFFNMLNIEEGVTLSDQKDGILLGKGLARAFDAKPGDQITILSNTVKGSLNGLNLTVTGIFHTGTKEFDDVVFRIPLEKSRILLDTQKLESIAVGLSSVDDWKDVSRFIASEYPSLEATPFEILDKVYYQHSVDWLKSQFQIIQIVILSVVLLGIFNSVSTSIFERKQEIGNLRANGDSKAETLILLAAEGAVLGLIGAVGGLLVSYLLNATLLRKGLLMPPAPGITRQFHVFIELQTGMAFESIILVSCTTLFGTLLAGLKVVRMKIGDALRAT